MHCYIRNVYWISTVFSYLFPFIWIPFVAGNGIGSFVYTVSLEIGGLALLMVVTLWYLKFMLGVDCFVLRIIHILKCEDDEFSTSDYHVAKAMLRDMAVITVLEDGIQSDIASIIISYLLDTQAHVDVLEQCRSWAQTL